MPQKRAAYKHLRKSKRKHTRNVIVISATKTLIKRFDSLLSEKKFEEAKKFLGTVSSKLRKAVSKGIMHKNSASRKISRLSKKLHQAASAGK